MAYYVLESLNLNGYIKRINQSKLTVLMKTIITSVLMAFTTLISAQTLMSEQGENVESWVGIESIGFGQENAAIVSIYIKNTGIEELEVEVERVDVTEANGNSLNYFCWGVFCYPPTTDVSPANNSVTIGPGQTDGSFKAYLESDSEGIFTATYIFREVGNPDNKVEVELKIGVTPTGITEMEVVDKVTNIYPNPANNIVNLDYTNFENLQNPNIVVHDLVGNQVYIDLMDAEYKLNNIQLSRFEDGYYIVSLVDNGRVLDTQRLIVRH